jgi:hypothetical protein
VTVLEIRPARAALKIAEVARIQEGRFHQDRALRAFRDALASAADPWEVKEGAERVRKAIAGSPTRQALPEAATHQCWATRKWKS